MLVPLQCQTTKQRYNKQTSYQTILQLKKVNFMENENNLQKFISEMRVKDYRRFIKDVQRYCGITRATLSFWRNGKVKPNQSSQRIINALATTSGYGKIYDLPLDKEVESKIIAN